MEKPEIMAPAGDWSCLRAAVKAGADAVYLGMKGASMRNKTENFTRENIKKVVDYCHKNNVKLYVTLNSIVFEWDLNSIESILKIYKQARVDAVICWDISVIKKARELGLNVHVSTQASISNSQAVNFYKKLGVSRVVLARECSLDQIKEIKKKTKIEIECFVHGAMCMAISGRCFLSQFTDDRSANRGVCVQNCRREYTVIDDAKNKLKLGNDYILSAEDLCTLPFIEKLIEANITCFKIEGRNKRAEYVKYTTEAYRKAVDFYFKNKDKKNFEKEFEKLKKALMTKLKQVYNRGFSSGFFLGKPLNAWNNVHGSKSTKIRIEVGRVENYYSKQGVATVRIFSKEIKTGNTIFIIGETTGILEQKVRSIERNNKKISRGKKGDFVAIKIDRRVREGDKVFLWVSRPKRKDRKP